MVFQVFRLRRTAGRKHPVKWTIKTLFASQRRVGRRADHFGGHPASSRLQRVFAAARGGPPYDTEIVPKFM